MWIIIRVVDRVADSFRSSKSKRIGVCMAGNVLMLNGKKRVWLYIWNINLLF